VQMSNTGTVTLLDRLGAVHDTITKLGFGAAGLCLSVVVCSYCFEVVSRYFLSAPTEWASPLVSYALCVMIFLAMPELTRRSAHISINILLDSVSPARAGVLTWIVRVVATIACLLAAWFSGNETLAQFNQDIWTSPPFATPKWTVSVFVPYGMLSSGIYFLRQILGSAPATASGGLTS
jgi:TRAP-type C4-dicarboxylate transport system permease small subunit